MEWEKVPPSQADERIRGLGRNITLMGEGFAEETRVTIPVVLQKYGSGEVRNISFHVRRAEQKRVKMNFEVRNSEAEKLH